MKEESKLTRYSRKWWFFLILILILAQFMVMPFATKNFSFEETGNIIWYTLGNSLQLKLYPYNIYGQVIVISMLLLLFVMKNKVARLFNIYVFVSYIVFAIVQNVAVTEKYGLSVVTINIIMFLFVAYVWLREIIKPENDYSFENFRWKDSWLIVLSLFAFWAPVSTSGFDFNPKYLLFGNSGSAFCLMTPVFLTIMTLNIPRINIVTYRITAIIGFIIGLYNMMNFANPQTVPLGIVHLPLVIISLYAAIRSYRIKKVE